MGGAIFGAFTLESIQLIAKHGLPGVEPYRGHLLHWLDKPQALKDLLDEYGIQLITASNGGPGQAMEFIDRSKREETIADHVTRTAQPKLNVPMEPAYRKKMAGVFARRLLTQLRDSAA